MGAKAAFERALEIDERTLGPNHPNVAIRVNNLGSVLKSWAIWQVRALRSKKR